MKKTIKNIEASVKAQLQNIAKQKNRPFVEILQYYSMERFLYRFGKSKYADKFILKGALLFTVWQIPERRTTLDIDFLAHIDNQVTVIESVMKDVCDIAVDPDGLKFESQTVKGSIIKEGADYEGVRVKFSCFLDRARIPMQIDVAFGDIVHPRIKRIDYPVILDFPKPLLKGYPPESVVSEKFEAMVKLGLLNSRMKDFYDIWLMMRYFEFKGASLVGAIQKTFNHRKTGIPHNKPFFDDEIYDETSDRQPLWSAFLRKGGARNVPNTLSVIAREIEKFLIEPIIAINSKVRFEKTWKSPNGWIQ